MQLIVGAYKGNTVFPIPTYTLFLSNIITIYNGQRLSVESMTRSDVLTHEKEV